MGEKERSGQRGGSGGIVSKMKRKQKTEITDRLNTTIAGTKKTMQ